MTDFNSIINGINSATQMIGAVNGAVNVLAPTLQTVNGAVNNIAGTIYPGYRQDMYMPPPGYYPQGTVPVNTVNPQSAPDESSIMGTIGSALGGGVVGAWQGKKLAETIKPPKNAEITPESSITSKMSAGGKTIAMTGLKAGGIGAAIGGLFSGIENIMKLSKNEITGGEATGNIVADTTVGFFTGIGGLATGTLAAMALSGIGGLPATIGAAALGLVGAVGVDLLFRKTGIRQSIADGIRSAVS